MKQAESPGQVPPQFLLCRAFRHEPRFVNDRATTRAGKVVEFTRETICDKCGTRVFATYSMPDLRVIRRKYDWPDYYRVRGGYPIHDARTAYIEQRFG